MEPVLKEIPIKLTPFSEWMKQQDWMKYLIQMLDKIDGS